MDRFPLKITKNKRHQPEFDSFFRDLSGRRLPQRRRAKQPKKGEDKEDMRGVRGRVAKGLPNEWVTHRLAA
jgi:hypothetical protein